MPEILSKDKRESWEKIHELTRSRAKYFKRVALSPAGSAANLRTEQFDTRAFIQLPLGSGQTATRAALDYSPDVEDRVPPKMAKGSRNDGYTKSQSH